MKKTISYLLLPLISLSTLSAQDFVCEWMPELSAWARTGFESEYVAEGSKGAAQNVQTEVGLSHPLFCGELSGMVWWMDPINDDGGTFSAAEEFNFTADYRLDFCEHVSARAGFVYIWYPNAAGPDSSGTLNREREIYAGLVSEVCEFEPSLTLSYNFDLERIILQGELAYYFELGKMLPGAERFGIDIHGYAAYLWADAFNGNQRSGGARHSNSYMYMGGHADLVFNYSKNLSFRAGPRVAYNNDGTPTFPSSGANALGDHHSLFWWGAGVNFEF